MDLSNYEIIEEEATVIVKSGLFAWKEEHQEIRLKELREHFGRYNPEKFEVGEAGLYIQPSIMYFGARFWMFILDVEDKSKHQKSIQANIDTAKNLFYLFDNLKIAEHLEIALTGNGFRFAMPYIIPNTHADAFLAMVADTNRFPGIDPSPQRGKGNFVRLFAYRGSKKQTSPPMDVHIHTLESPHNILGLDERKYKALVKGRPGFDQCSEDLSKLIPRGFAPAPLIQLLECYNMEIRLKSTIVTPKGGKFSAEYQANTEQILEYVDGLNIPCIEHEWSEGMIYKLDTCPVCGESDGNPYIIPSNGVLKCWRANNCEAGQGGLPPSQWVEGYNPIEKERQHDELPAPKLSLEDARKITNNAFSEALSTGNDMIINTSMGVGKTTVAIANSVPQATEKLILFTVPTTALASEIYEAVQEKARMDELEINVRQIVGRNSENCEKVEDIHSAAEKGYTPAYIICVGCPYRKKCPYLEQFTKIPETGIIVTTHYTAAYHKERISPDIWIIDENVTNHFFGIYTATQFHMNDLQELETKDVGPLFDDIRSLSFKAASKMKEHDEARLYVKDTPPGRWEDSFTLENIHPEIATYFDIDLFPTRFSFHHFKSQNEFQWESMAYREEVQLETVKWWDQVIYDEDNALAYIKINVVGGSPVIKYIVVKSSPPQLDNCQVIHLDGTVYRPEAEVLFPEAIEIVDAQVNLDSCHKTHVKAARGKTVMLKFGHYKKQQEIAYLLGFLRPQDKKVLIITHKSIEESVLGLARSIQQDIEFKSFHFWGPRGINEFKDFDACISYGTPTVNPNSVSDIAMMLFEDEAEIDDWKDSLRKRDLAQAIHRIRPVNGNKNIIVMGSYWPAEYLGSPDLQVNLMRKGENHQEAKQRLVSFIKRYGFLTKPAAMLLNIATRDDEDILYRVQEDLARRLDGSSDFVSTLINIYKSGDKVEGTDPTIFLRSNNSWKKLVDDVHIETGYPYMLFHPKGRGRQSLALGSAEAVGEFCMKLGTRFDPSEFEACLN